MPLYTDLSPRPPPPDLGGAFQYFVYIRYAYDSQCLSMFEAMVHSRAKWSQIRHSFADALGHTRVLVQTTK